MIRQAMPWHTTPSSVHRVSTNGSAVLAGRATTITCRSVSAVVSAGGRLFYIFDEGPRASIEVPSQWSLIARDAFNGTILWKREIPHRWQCFVLRTEVAKDSRREATGNWQTFRFGS